MLVDKGSHQGVPDDVDDTDYEKHNSGYGRVEPVDVGVEEEKIHADGLVDEVLGEVAGAKSDTLQHGELVEALGLPGSCGGCVHMVLR